MRTRTALTAVMLLLAWPAAGRAATVTVEREGEAGRTLDLAALTQDVVERDYTVRTAAGEQVVRVRGTSLNTLLDAAKADLIGAGSIEISAGGRKALLSRDQLSGAGAGSPLFYEENGQGVFLRPAYNADDLNGNSRVAGADLRVRILQGKALTVRAKVSDAAVRVGQTVTFTATGRGGDGQVLRYGWTFGDGSRRQTGQTARHRFTEEGSYKVVVGLTTPGDQAGTQDIIDVRVGPAPKGPDREGGGTNAAASAPSSGTAAGGDSGTSGGTGSAAGGPARASVPRDPPRRARPAPAPGDRQIEGTLLSGATAVPAARKRAARTGNDKAQEKGGFGVPGAALGVLVTLGLAGTGALVELRGVTPWARRRPA